MRPCVDLAERGAPKRQETKFRAEQEVTFSWFLHPLCAGQSHSLRPHQPRLAELHGKTASPENRQKGQVGRALRDSVSPCQECSFPVYLWPKPLRQSVPPSSRWPPSAVSVPNACVPLSKCLFPQQRQILYQDGTPIAQFAKTS